VPDLQLPTRRLGVHARGAARETGELNSLGGRGEKEGHHRRHKGDDEQAGVRPVRPEQLAVRWE
jgi:hypothetical protein